MNQLPSSFWSIPVDEMLQKLESTKDGLTSGESLRRLARYGGHLTKRILKHVKPKKVSKMV
jgi:hypothetical protein